MKRILVPTAVLLMTLNLTSCNSVNNQDVGTLSGAVAGGLLGSQLGGGTGKLFAVGAGTLAGAFIGGKIGHSMDQTDQLKMTQTFEKNNVGQPAYWQNQNSGNQYKVTPTRNVAVGSNKYCREYTSTAVVAGKNQQIYGTACRQPDGSWKIIK